MNTQTRLSSSPTPARLQTLTRWLIAAVGVVMIGTGIYLFLIQLRFVTSPGSDYRLYYSASVNLLDGRSIYANENWQSPFLAVLLAPLALLPYEVSAVVWSILLLVWYLGLGWIVISQLKIRLALPYWLLLVGFALCWFPFQENISQGQISIFLSLLMLAGWAQVRSGKEISGGALLGAAAAAKLFPALLIVYLVLRKRLRAAVVMAAAAVGLYLLTLIIVGWDDMRYFAFEIMLSSSLLYASLPINLSLRGIASRVLTDGPWVEPIANLPGLANILVAAGSAVILAILVIQLIRLPKTQAGDDRGFVFTVFAMLLLSPISWPHIFPVLALPLGLLLKEMLETRNLWIMRLGLIQLMLVSVPALKLGAVLVLRHTPERIPWQESLILAIPTLAVILNWVLLAVKLPLAPMRNSGGETAAASGQTPSA